MSPYLIGLTAGLSVFAILLILPLVRWIRNSAPRTSPRQTAGNDQTANPTTPDPAASADGSGPGFLTRILSYLPGKQFFLVVAALGIIGACIVYVLPWYTPSRTWTEIIEAQDEWVTPLLILIVLTCLLWWLVWKLIKGSLNAGLILALIVLGLSIYGLGNALRDTSAGIEKARIILGATVESGISFGDPQAPTASGVRGTNQIRVRAGQPPVPFTMRAGQTVRINNQTDGVSCVSVSWTPSDSARVQQAFAAGTNINGRDIYQHSLVMNSPGNSWNEVVPQDRLNVVLRQWTGELPKMQATTSTGPCR
ncbi:hypothetical protein K2Q16_04530 [Patescibacteria group bacterium]|nr:hypothetical protein [Patescibacteria group bacterium]